MGNPPVIVGLLITLVRNQHRPLVEVPRITVRSKHSVSVQGTCAPTQPGEGRDVPPRVGRLTWCEARRLRQAGAFAAPALIVVY